MQKSPKVDSVDIPADVLSQLEELPDRRNGSAPVPFTPEQDAILLRYWPRKPQEAVAKIIGFGVRKCKARYKELTLDKK